MAAKNKKVIKSNESIEYNDEIIAAITMALSEDSSDAHDYEDMRLTINNGKPVRSPWNLHILMMPETPEVHKSHH